jgi:hypothetical protein
MLDINNWIPAFAGMTENKKGMTENKKGMTNEGRQE